MAIVRVEDATKIYDEGKVETTALREVSFQLEQGEFAAVAGPSGSGKTTLLNLIGGLDVPTSGRIFIEEDDLTKLSKGKLSELRLRKLGFIFQAYNLIPVLTALENVEFVMLLQGIGVEERRRKATAILEEVGLKDLINKRPNEMSGGQQQRVAVTRAIVSQPALVLADEPTANLDSHTAGNLLDMMSDLNKKRGITFLFSTHDPLVMERARRLLRLRDGEIADDERRG